MNDLDEKRRDERVVQKDSIQFTVLFTESEDLKKAAATGEIINKSRDGIGIITDYPLEPGHVLQWDDKHKKGSLHMASVRWSTKIGDFFRAGLLFI